MVTRQMKGQGMGGLLRCLDSRKNCSEILRRQEDEELHEDWWQVPESNSCWPINSFCALGWSVLLHYSFLTGTWSDSRCWWNWFPQGNSWTNEAWRQKHSLEEHSTLRSMFPLWTSTPSSKLDGKWTFQMPTTCLKRMLFYRAIKQVDCRMKQSVSSSAAKTGNMVFLK